MDTTFFVTCPFCYESQEIYVEEDVHGAFVQDCEVCCRPWSVHVHTEHDGTRTVDVRPT